MKQTLKIFQIGLAQIARDGMLFALLLAPVLIGLLFKLAIPFAGRVLEEHLAFSLRPWYALADGLLLCLVPMFTAMICAFLLLEERDEGISAFYGVTPAAGYAYLAARVGLPMLWAFFVTAAVTLLCGLAGLAPAVVLCCALVSTLAGAAAALLLVGVAANRVEGLALSKLMGISLLGLVAVWAFPAPYAWFTAFLPSFWIGRMLADGPDGPSLFAAFFLCLLWILLFARRFRARLA